MPRPRKNTENATTTETTHEVLDVEALSEALGYADPIETHELISEAAETIVAQNTEIANLRDLVLRLDGKGSEYTPIRKLWELASKFGAQIRSRFDRDSIIKALSDVGYDFNAEPEPERPEDYWSFDSRIVGTGPVSGKDPSGFYSAYVNPDGSAEITMYQGVSLINRRPGERYADAKFKVPSLEGFTCALVLLTQESDAIFDETAEYESEKAHELAHRKPASSVDDLKGNRDERIYTLNDMCAEFGLVGPHAPSLQEMPYKLAEAVGAEAYFTETSEVRDTYGAPVKDKNGKSLIETRRLERKPWGEVVDIVIAKHQS